VTTWKPHIPPSILTGPIIPIPALRGHQVFPGNEAVGFLTRREKKYAT
jgi:hypothetical protein